MTKTIPAAHYRRAPTIIAFFGSVGVSAHIIMAYALSIHSYPLLFLGAVLLGTGSGALYVASVDVLQAWVPEAPGLITGIGMLFGGTGTLFGICIFRALIDWFNSSIRAITVVGVVTGGLAFMAAPFVQRPPLHWHPEHDLQIIPPLANDPSLNISLPSETTKLLPTSPTYAVYHNLSVQDVLTDTNFYLLICAFGATVGPGFGFVLAFQTMCAGMFGVTVDYANKLFFWVTLTGIAGRLFAGLCVDFLTDASSRDDGLRAAQSTNVILLTLQFLSIVSMPFFIRGGYVIAFTIAASITFITFSGGAVVAACIVRGIFLPNNASLAFSISGTAIGAGDLFYSWVIAQSGKYAALQTALNGDIVEYHYDDYNLFLISASIWSVAGLIATTLLQKSKKVSGDESKVMPLAQELWSDSDVPTV